MAERYGVIKHERNIFWLSECPLILLSHALSKDNLKNELFLQCKFENLSEKQIKAVYISVLCYDTTNNILQGIDNFAYLDLIVEQHQIFGDRIPVYIPDKETRNVSIIVNKIVFVDSSIWENKSLKPFELAKYEQEPIKKLGELEEQYRRDLSNICSKVSKQKYLPIHINNYNICGCGKITLDNEKNCPICGIDVEKSFNLNNIDRLQVELSYYNEEQEKIKQHRQIQEQITKQNNIIIAKKIGIILGSIILIIAFITFSINIVIPNIKYIVAQNAVASEDYDNAINIFQSLDEFKDSKEKVKETKYLLAEYKLSNGDKQGALEIFEHLEDYNNSYGKIREIIFDDTHKIVNAMVSAASSTNFIVTVSINDDVINFNISSSGVTLNNVPQQLSDFSFEKTSYYLENIDELYNTIGTWIDTKNSFVNLQNTILEKFEQASDYGYLYSIHTVVDSNDNIKIFEFEDSELTFNYWNYIEKYYGHRLTLFSDLFSHFGDIAFKG